MPAARDQGGDLRIRNTKQYHIIMVLPVVLTQVLQR